MREVIKGTLLSKVCLCVKLLGDVAAAGAGACRAAAVAAAWPLLLLVLVLIYPKHAPLFGNSGSTYILNTPPSCGDSVSSYIWNTPPHLAIPVQHILNTPSHLAIHAPSCGDSGSPYILSCPVIYILAKDNLEFPIISSAGVCGGPTNTMIA